MKGWVGLVGWPVENGLPTLVVTHQLQVERRTGKVRQSEADVIIIIIIIKGIYIAQVRKGHKCASSTTVPRHQLIRWETVKIIKCKSN